MEADFSLKNATIGIIGLGLMGGSLAMSLNGKCARIIGFDSHLPTLELALSKKIIDQAEQFDAAGRVRRYRDQGIDILIIATPVSTIIDILKQLSSFISDP
ncbi:MAG TPA: NAD(P)-binding domain-containing protein, partial [Anaerolineales bacterium]|nr:NAD(P)-binding domain-containing protein [Anaerolineales bacterium]